jgi:hypothetical protein
MSWFIAAIGPWGEAELQKLAQGPRDGATIVQDGSFTLKYGGENAFCISYARGGEDGIDRGAVVCGVGLDLRLSGTRMMGSSEWHSLLKQGDEHCQLPDGHFAGLMWTGGHFTLFTDQLGLRDLHVWQKGEQFLVATSPSLIAQVFSGLEIDTTTFGSTWLQVNSLTRSSVFAELTRISGGRAHIERGKCETSIAPWVPTLGVNKKSEHLRTFLSTTVNSTIQGSDYSALCLSGGTDSRALLSLLAPEYYRCVEAVTLGDSAHPDSVIALRLADKTGIRHTQFDWEFPALPECEAQLDAYTQNMHCCQPASGILNARYFDAFRSRYSMMIDGGFGEIWRSGFLNRLRYAHTPNIIADPAAALRGALRHSRGSFFDTEFVRTMERGALRASQDAVHSLPAISDCGLDNWLDLIAVNFRLPTYYGPEQARLDDILPSFMPFAQRTLLNELFALSVSVRNGEKFFRSLISTNRILRSTPLVKGSLLVPAWAPSVLKRAIGLVGKRLPIGYRRDLRSEFLWHIQDLVQERLGTTSAIPAPCEPSQVRRVVDGFYEGNGTLASELDWLITFAFWWRAHT